MIRDWCSLTLLELSRQKIIRIPKYEKNANISGDLATQTELWSNVGTFVHRFIKVSRINARKSGLTLTRAWILQVISQRGEMTATELSVYTGTAPPTITDILDGLERTHCILKKKSAKDERKLAISVSATGEEKLRKFLSLQWMFVETIEQATDKEFLESLLSIFRTLVRITGTFD